ncbi:MAG TPA: hypothetical protein VF598_04845 [Hymenobacter sp.]|jgi:hypothetical protein
MPTKRFYLDASETHVIELKWGLFWKNLTVSENGQMVGQVAGRSDLQHGRTFPLADGRTLRVALRRVLTAEELEVLLDGQPLAGSATHPQQRLKQALYALLFLVGVNLVLGLVAELGHITFLQTIGLGYGTVVVGLVYLGLYWWAKTRLSSLALYIAMGLVILDFVLAVGLSASGGASVSPGSGVIMRLVICVLLYKGAEGARQLRAETLSEAASATA